MVKLLGPGHPFRLSALLLGCVLPVVGCGGTGISGSAAMKHVETWVKDIGPRPPGSPEIRKKAKYIYDNLTALGLKPQLMTWTDPAEKIEFQNVWVEIPGKDPAAGPILGIGAHYDTKKTEGHPEPQQNFRFVGAIDGGGGPAVLLELARVLKDRKNGPNIWLIWLDGEESLEFEWNTKRSLFGSRYFADAMGKDKVRFPKGFSERFRVFVLLDLVGSKNPKVDRDVLSNAELLEIFTAAADELGEKARMFKFEPPGGITDDHEPFRNKGAAVINLIDFAHRIPAERMRANPNEKAPEKHPDYDAWWHTERDNLDAMSTDSLAFFGNLVLKALPGIEQKFYAK